MVKTAPDRYRGASAWKDRDMSAEPIRFDDGAAYETTMGAWSQLVGRDFLDWLEPGRDLRWVDVGCGNGAFTELIVERCSPAQVHGIDPSDGQISYAKTRPGAKTAHFQTGDALSLPFEDGRFDIAIMALVLFFVPDPKRGLDEMIRVTRRGGLVAAYVWDFPGGGFPMEAIQAEMRAGGITPALPPHAEIARAEALHALWSQAGLERIEQRAVPVQRSFADFDHFWEAGIGIGSMKATVAGMDPAARDKLKARVRARLAPPDTDGRIIHSACANAIRGYLPS